MTSAPRYTIQNPPDGGWGWVIVVAAFLTFFMTTGTMMSMSVMYVAWLDEFHTSRGLTSWIIAVAVAVMFGIGPIPAHLAIRFGYKAVMFAGGLLAFFGFVVSSFATSVPMLIFTIGIVVGTGCGFCFLPAIAMVSLYFDKKRSLAMGIAAAGAGIGSLVGGQVLHNLEETYGWRGAMLVFGGIQLHLIALALLMRPLPAGPGICEDLIVAVDDINEEDAGDDTTESLLGGGDTHSIAGPEAGEKHSIGGASRNTSHMDSSERMHMAHSHSDNPQMLLSVPLSVNPQHRRLLNMEAGVGGTGSLQHLAVPRSATSRLFSSAHDINPKKCHDTHHKNSIKHSGNLDILLSGSMHSLFLINNNMLKYDDSFSHHSLNMDASSSSKSDADTLALDREEGSCLPYKACMASIASNIALLKSPSFFMFIFSNILTNLSFFMPNLYMVDRALDEGLSKEMAATLVSINGAGNVFGRLFFGYLADKKIMQRISWYIFVLGVCGVATCFSPLCGGSVVLHAIYAFTFGCFIGAYVTLAPVVTVDLVGVELVGQAYGLALFFMGAAGLIGSPLGGWIFDWTGDYTTSFIVHGVFLAVSAVVLIPVAVYTGRRLAHTTHEES
ncbi:monocarboxylate transporter [Plakobranchus ocellatus]|uniref:Monocarboxylate transporter n=1 Tax=Plakobranchus ocellatus TaxID=259542 RepID=A0AAV4ASD9_9GAST|nr:monocarboxylate transporter [Plakobranchus ocellatus]